MRRPAILALCVALLVVAGSSTAECGEKNPTPALLDTVKASLADLKPITVQIDHDKIAGHNIAVVVGCGSMEYSAIQTAPTELD